MSEAESVRIRIFSMVFLLMDFGKVYHINVDMSTFIGRGSVFN